MNFIILDLEWNPAFSKKIKAYINEIIEFGAVKCDENLNIISTFSSFVKPQVGKKINTVVSELTSIKYENLSHAGTYMNVVSKFKKWAGDDSVILTWGTSDILTLIENCKYFSNSRIIPFLYKYIDLQKYCESLLSNQSKDQLGLSAAAKILSIDCSQMEHHRALDDSLMSLAVIKRLYPQNSVAAFVEDAKNPEFYKKITFKTSIISDITHPMITKNNFKFVCEKCGGEAQRLSKWQFRNKRFVSDFKCPKCSYKFSGRIQIKEKYEGLVINKKSVSLPKIEPVRKANSGDIANMHLTIHKNKVGLLTFNKWNDLKEISHAFSTRIGGVSKDKYESMNLGYAVGDSDDLVSKNYELICEAFGCKVNSLISGSQVHGINIANVGYSNAGYTIKTGTDGLCTNEKNVTLMIYAADCVPMYFYDPVKKCIGLAHAGWRGTANGMAKAMIEKLASDFDSKAEDILVAIGPSICETCFEVDPPCADEFMKIKDFEHFVNYTGKDKYHVNLWECNRRFLINAGVKAENITVGEVCSMCNSDLIFSHRATKGHRGSNAGFMKLN